MEMMTYDDMAKVAHETAVEKGWWEEPREPGTILMLIGTEVDEAIVASLSGNVTGKDGVAEEVADVCIRIFDFFGYHEKSIENHRLEIGTLDRFIYPMQMHTNEPFLALYRLLSRTMETYRNHGKIEETFLYHLGAIILLCERIADYYNFDLEEEIKNKIEVNKDREYKHGGKYV